MRLGRPRASARRTSSRKSRTTALWGRSQKSISHSLRLPEFTALKSKTSGNLLQGRIQISPEIDYLERAFDESKYGNFSRNPYIEITFPSLSDPSLAPAGQHVMSIYMQYAPYKLKNSDWESQRKALGETVVKTIAQYAPNLPQTILRHQIITPKDLEETYGLTGGHIFHGELALDQFFTMRPLLDWARYQTPIERSICAAVERILGLD